MRRIPMMCPSQCMRQGAVRGLRRDRARCWKAALVFVLLLSAAILAKTPGGTITGTVKSEAGGAIPHAKVIARSSGRQVVASTLTDGHGRFRFPPLQPGTYEVEVEFRGQWKTGARQVSVSEGEQAVLSFVGRPAGEGTADKSDGLGPVSFYNDSGFKRGGLKNPSGGGGYSNAASAQAVKILNQYLSPRESPAAESGTAGKEKPGESGGTHEAALERSGRGLLEKKNYEQAAKVFEKATALYPRSERLRMGLGLSLYGAGKYRQAAVALQEAVRLAPDDSAPIVMLAEALQSVQDPAAERLLERFSKSHPENARGHYAYGLALWQEFRVRRSAEKLAGAQSEFENAVSLDPDDADAHLQLGMIYDEQGAPARAVAEYVTAIRVDPGLAAAHYRLAQDYERLGEKEEAGAEFEKYEKLGGHISP